MCAEQPSVCADVCSTVGVCGPQRPRPCLEPPFPRDLDQLSGTQDPEAHTLHPAWTPEAHTLNPAWTPEAHTLHPAWTPEAHTLPGPQRPTLFLDPRGLDPHEGPHLSLTAVALFVCRAWRYALEEGHYYIMVTIRVEFITGCPRPLSLAV